MNTFLPFADFKKSATVLDSRRLNKQAVECVQILSNLRYGGAWSNHPAVKMWKGSIWALEEYLSAIVDECRIRGIKTPYSVRATIGQLPWWLGNEEFHNVMKGNLIRKDPKYYGTMWPEVEPVTGYLWPTEDGKFRDLRK